MKRAAILIGVDKTGDLPKLKDAAKGAQLMAEWAHTQGMDTTLFTDVGGAAVDPRDIGKAIRKLVDKASYGQLLVYFAGHGIVRDRQEVWLLSDAPEDAGAAVNLGASAMLAATCGIPHVVFISDACRTAPEGIQAQSVQGVPIFPNLEQDEKPVDKFFASQLGKPSLEVRDPALSSSQFQALYTHELMPALRGERPALVTWPDTATAPGHVQMRPLRDHLVAAVTQRLADLKLDTERVQVPVAQISSDPPAWLAEVARTVATGTAAAATTPTSSAPGGLRGGLLAGGLRTASPTSPTGAIGATGAARAPASPEAITARLLREAIGAAQAAVAATASRALRSKSAPMRAPAGTRRGLGPAASPTRAATVSALQREADVLTTTFGPAAHESQCGFKLRGAAVVRTSSTTGVRLESADGPAMPSQDLRAWGVQRPGALVLLEFDNGAAALLPALPHFLCALSFADGELVDVAYEPSANSPRWNEFNRRAGELRRLRAVASAAMAEGSFQLEGDDALALARHMQAAKAIDPAWALYAAHAYHELQRRDLIQQMHGFMLDDLGGALFDVALLARRVESNRAVRDWREAKLLNPLPLLSPTWALWSAFSLDLPAALAPLASQRLPSLWTLYNPAGVDTLRRAIAQGVLQ